jgi:hypothetical protein
VSTQLVCLPALSDPPRRAAYDLYLAHKKNAMSAAAARELIVLRETDTRALLYAGFDRNQVEVIVRYRAAILEDFERFLREGPPIPRHKGRHFPRRKPAAKPKLVSLYDHRRKVTPEIRESILGRFGWGQE